VISTVFNFLQAVADKILLENSGLELSKLDGTKFQALVLETANKLNEEGGYGLTVRGTPPQAFPDMVVDRTGVEIKSTVQDHWTTTGNSITESRRDSEIDEVVFFFGKLGGTPGIKIREYEQCLPNIVVTHNPRYMVDMDLALGKSIFDKVGVTYQQFQELGFPISLIRNYLRSQLKPGEELWWLGGPADESKEIDSGDVQNPILMTLTSRDPRRTDFMRLALAIRPEVLGPLQTKYERLPALLLKRFGAVTSSMRDFFSAGGRHEYEAGPEGSGVPLIRAVDAKVLENAFEIKQIIDVEPIDSLLFGWGVKTIEANRTLQYAGILSNYSRTFEYDLGQLFLHKLES
jgi:hypothetical protein